MKLKNALQDYAGKRVLVTGGAGCIGSNLVRALVKVNVEKVTVVDDFSASPRWNLSNHPEIFLVNGSILSEEKLKNAFSDGPQYVFHLAAHFANQNSVDHPETNLMVNGLGTLKVLQHSHLAGVEKFVFASSGCSVYGNEAPLPLIEDFVSLHLDSPYQIHKLLGELYCNFFSNFYGLPVVILRYFNVYGPGEVPSKYRNVIPNFIWWALQKQQLPITGTGEETRDFTFVDDIIEATLKAGVVPEALGESINIASETETRVIDLANTICELTGNDNGVKFVGRRKWDKIVRRRASIEKAKRILGYEPKVEMREGLEKTVDWFLQNRSKIETSVQF